MPKGLVKQMRSAGCHVALFREMRWFDWMKYNHRTHRRLLIVDGMIGFTGGVGIADEWSGHAQSPEHWRDTHVRLTGLTRRLKQGEYVPMTLIIRSADGKEQKTYIVAEVRHHSPSEDELHPHEQGGHKHAD